MLRYKWRNSIWSMSEWHPNCYKIKIIFNELGHKLLGRNSSMKIIFMKDGMENNKIRKVVEELFLSR